MENFFPEREETPLGIFLANGGTLDQSQREVLVPASDELRGEGEIEGKGGGGRREMRGREEECPLRSVRRKGRGGKRGESEKGLRM